MKFNKVFRLFAVLALLVVFASLPTVAVSAAPQLAPAFQDAPAFPSIEDIFITLKNSVGIALLGAAILNLCKQRGWLKDGDTPTFSLIFQSVGFFSFLLLTLFGKANLIPVVDESAGTVANILNSLVVLAFQLYAARKGHEEVLAGMPGIGTSFSGRKAGEGAMIETFETVIDEGRSPEEFGEFKA